VYNEGSIYGGPDPEGFTASATPLVLGAVGNGVYMGAGGEVDNEGSNSIAGYYNGVCITGGAGSVYNDYGGSIYGYSSNGVYMGQGGSVYNDGHIEGYYNGVYITSGAGDVYNDYDGIIHGDNYDGVYMGQGGTVTNYGTISGNGNGVDITGGNGSVYNGWWGSIIGTNNNGVYLGAGGSVYNEGTISGYNNGVSISGGEGYVYNDGWIYGGVNYEEPIMESNARPNAGGGSDGVYMGAGGEVDNYWYIEGTNNGVEITGGTGYVYNDGGGIFGDSYDGVYMGAGGQVYNEWYDGYGYIEGNNYGVEITGGEGYVYNDGYIYGDNNDGVRLRAGGSVENYGYIEGNTSGVKITGGEGSVYNDGEIYGDNYDGVYMDAGGSVYNDWYIGGNEYGVEISGGAGYVTNYEGSIIGTNHDGVRLRDGGVVNNKWGGDIEGYTQGVKITGGPGTVINSGTIIGDDGTAILLDPGSYNNTVTLETGSDVQGNIVGGAGTDAAFLQGHGSYSSNFLNFETLTVQGDSSSTGWNLTGTNTFSEDVTVESGLLRINGSLITSNLNVDITGGLGGTGTVSGIVGDHGFISPGNSIGTLNIVGGLDMTNGIYNEQVDAAGNSDLINVSGSPGTAIISNASVVVLPAHEIYAAHTVYTNLTATGGVLGTNTGVSIATPTLFLTASLQYPTTNIVTMSLDRSAFVTVANTYNQHSVAGALDGIVDSPGAMSNLVSEFFWLPSAAAAQRALDSMSGEIHGSLGMLDVQQQDAFNRSVSLRTGRISAGGENGGYASARPIQLASADSTPLPAQSDANDLLDNIWLQGFGSFGHLDGDGNASGGSFTISGMNGGFDYRLSPEVLVGLAVGYSHDDATVGGPGANGKVDAFQFGGYGGYVNGPWHLDGIFSYGFLKTDTKRFIDVGSIHQEADGSYDGGVFSLSTEGGYVFKFDRVTIEPTVGLNYAHLSQNSFNESGTASDGHNYGLSVNSVDMDSLRSVLGVRLAAQFGKKDGVQFIPALRAGWEHEFMDKTADVNARFVGGSGDFDVKGVKLGADSGVLGAGLTVAFNKAIQGFVNYDANLNTRMSSHAISGGLSYSW
jgi:outer membrane autotransporter protein